MITTTYAGETVSIAASIATLDEIVEKDIFTHLTTVGNELREGMGEIIKRKGLPLYYTGRPALTRLFANTGDAKRDFDIQCKISRHYMAKGFFVKEHGGVSYYLNYSHKKKDIERLLNVTEEAFLSGFEK
jgi:glutamate-1-semialdehyde aminotransferase